MAQQYQILVINIPHQIISMKKKIQSKVRVGLVEKVMELNIGKIHLITISRKKYNLFEKLVKLQKLKAKLNKNLPLQP